MSEITPIDVSQIDMSRFWSKVVADGSGCWLWQPAPTANVSGATAIEIASAIGRRVASAQSKDAERQGSRADGAPCTTRGGGATGRARTEFGQPEGGGSVSSRLRQGSASGMITDNPLTDTATSISSSEFQTLIVVSGGDVLEVTLDPEEVDGAWEIVHVTEHVGGSPTVTVLRAQEGTVSREHAQSTTWVHGPTIADFPPMNEDGLIPGSVHVDGSAPTTQEPPHLWLDTSENPPVLKVWED